MRRALVVATAVALIGLALDLALRGYTSGVACHWGFGQRLHAVRDAEMRVLFPEPLPLQLDNIAMNCHSWVDFSLEAHFSIPRAEAQPLIDALEETYLTPQNDPIVTDSQKRRTLIGPPTHSTYVYFLPGVAALQFRTVSVTVPVNEALPATVLLEGGTL